MIPHSTLVFIGTLPAITVIIPTKGRIEFLKQSITSVVAQGVQQIEVFIADNNSDPEISRQIKEIILEFTIQAPEILWTYLHSTKPNAAGARNDAMLASKGKYIFFLDDDDEFLPGSIEKRMAELRAHPETAFLYCGAYSKIYPYPFKIYRYFQFRTWQHPDKIPVMSCSCITVNRDILAAHQLYFDETLPRRHDFDFCRRVALKKLAIRSMPEPLVQINHHEYNRISSRPFRKHPVAKKLADKWGPVIDKSTYEYAGGILVWRKCFGADNRGYAALCEEFREDFNRELSPLLKFELRLVCVHPVVFLGAYHLSLIALQGYKNKLAPLVYWLLGKSSR